MQNQVRFAFEPKIITLPLALILPRKRVTDDIRKSVKYKRISKSIEEIGIIEPLVISKLEKRDTHYLLLDGHMRFSVLLESGITKARCLIADDDEAFTYNKRVNRLATVQEHYMLKRAVKRGVSEEKLAKALGVNISLIKRRQKLLDNICPEAIELLKNKSVNPTTFDTLRKMKPMRQIEVVELMAAAGNWTTSYAKALLVATKQEDLTRPDRSKKVVGISPEQIARMEREMTSLHKDLKQTEDTYGEDMLHLVIASGYLAKLVNNVAIEHFLTANHAEILKEFRAIITATSLDNSQDLAA